MKENTNSENERDEISPQDKQEMDIDSTDAKTNEILNESDGTNKETNKEEVVSENITSTPNDEDKVEEKATLNDAEKSPVSDKYESEGKEEKDETSRQDSPDTTKESSTEKVTEKPKLNDKKKKIIGGVAAVIVAASCIVGGVSYDNYQKAQPDARLNQAITYIKEGDFDDVSSYASKSGYWQMADLLGSDATDAQRAKIAKLMYGDLDFTIKKVSVNKANTSAVVTAKVKNYNVYSAALGVQITTEEMEGKTAAESRALLVKKANKQINAYKKKNKKSENTVHFNMIKKNGNWVIDTSDSENKMSLLSLLGIQVDTYDTSSSTTSQKENNTNKKASKKKSEKKNTSKTSGSSTSTSNSVNSNNTSTSTGSESSKKTKDKSSSQKEKKSATKKSTDE